MVPVLVPLYILLCIIYSFGIKFYLKKKKKKKEKKKKDMTTCNNPAYNNNKLKSDY